MSITDLPQSPSPAGGVAGLDLLGQARAARQCADASEAEILVVAVEWAVANPPLLGRDATAWYAASTSGEHKQELSAEGVPDVDRGAVGELGLALGVSTQAAAALVAEALELAYRLPTLWARVVAGEVAPWRARKVAQATRPLSRLAAAYVDRQIASLAHRVSTGQLQGLVDAAMIAHDQDLAAQVAAERAELRDFQVHLNEVGLSGLVPVSGVLDLPDAQDLDAALSQAAQQLAAWGSPDPLGVRRARGMGELARDYLTLTGNQDDDGDDGDESDESGASAATHSSGAGAGVERRGGRVPSKRQLVLYAHLTEATILDMINGRSINHVGRVENTDTPVTAETIRDWVGDPGTSVSVRPVLDVAEYLQAGAYEFPTRLKERIRLRDGTCIFPGCRARAMYAQIDHRDPYDHEHPEQGGPTDTDNGHLLCQRHHTLKTHHGFRYTLLANGAVLWRTPHGLLIRRNPDGSVDYLTKHRHSRESPTGRARPRDQPPARPPGGPPPDPTRRSNDQDGPPPF